MSSFVVAGMDEAGKGPVIGPMVICLFETEEEKLPLVKSAGAKDSKLLSERRREEILERLRGLGRWHISIITAAELDAREGSLNAFEIRKMAELMTRSSADRIYVDSIEANGKRLGEKLLAALPPEMKRPEMIARPKADRDFPIVGAASIVAKVTREKEIARLRQEYGDFGSGYPADPKTQAFLREELERKGFLPAIVRKSWATTKELLAGRDQAKLG